MVFSNLSLECGDKACPEAVQRALCFLRETDFDQLPDGEYPVMGRMMYAKVFHLRTKPAEETRPELHRNYIDVQYWISGSERFGIAPCTEKASQVSEDPAEDVYFYENAPGESFVLASAGDYAVFYPWDYHRPGTLAGKEAQECRKAVVKVGMELLDEMGMELPNGRGQTDGRAGNPAGAHEGPAGEHEGSAGAQEGSAGAQDRSAGKHEGLAGEHEGPVGKHENPAGKQELPAGKQEFPAGERERPDKAGGAAGEKGGGMV